MIIPWNLTQTVNAQRDADTIVISPAKAGRTWLRVMINKYLSLHYGVDFSLDDLHRHHAPIPSIIYEHWLWLHLRQASWKQRLRGKFIIPRDVLKRKKLLLLVRDPRDTIVSAYFQETEREQGKRRVDMTLAQFIRDRKRGIDSLVRVMNLTRAKTKSLPNILLLKYEQIKADPAAELERALRFIGVTIDPAYIAQAVAFGSFENMKRMERDNEIDNFALRAVDVANPDSYKVRRGKIGGYTDYLDEADVAYLEQRLAKLDPVFGYDQPWHGAAQNAGNDWRMVAKVLVALDLSLSLARLLLE
jgi:hypothetical protein